MKIIILTGPAGSGKNTVGYALAKKRKKCAVIDVDLVRWMLYQPHKAPWEAGEEGKDQQKLGIINTCILAKNFIQNSCDVIILDVVTNETANIYNDQLMQNHPKIILLLPTFLETQKRMSTRKFRITDEEEKLVYAWQENFNAFDEKIDNSNIPAETVAEKIYTSTFQ